VLNVILRDAPSVSLATPSSTIELALETQLTASRLTYSMVSVLTAHLVTGSIAPPRYASRRTTHAHRDNSTTTPPLSVSTVARTVSHATNLNASSATGDTLHSALDVLDVQITVKIASLVLVVLSTPAVNLFSPRSS
jgi:hypothetical protein